ncbi:hypothetical protein LXM94_16555 [Rhizobium sp. TRM95111]|uniref:hypothetical protein n=1 Tax=Rhizobium alarense TaxID=2846851 RepID=UPI001F2FBD19|nr:hypothetical protein [Rhizobium alarense]MCF3641585.1 hypothetical protein [Rhizobium alarense]
MMPKIPLLALFLALLGSYPAMAERSDIRLSVISQPASEVVETLSFMSGIPVTTAGTLSGRIENLTISGDPVQAFATLGRAGNLFVAFDGTRVIVSSKSELSTAVFPRKGSEWASMKRAIDALFPLYPAEAIEHEPTSDILIVRGPPIFVSTIETLLNRSRKTTVQVVRGRQVDTLVFGEEGGL